MKKIFNEYGGVVVTVIAVVAVIGLVSFLMKPGGVIDGAFTTLVQTFVDKSDASLDAAGAGGAGGAGGSGEQGGSGSVLNPSGTIPEGATYTTGGYFDEDEWAWVSGDTVTYTAGDSFPDAVNAGDFYTYGDYEYCYGYSWCECGCWSTECGCLIEYDGWAVRCINDVAEPGAILESINGESIVCLMNTFWNCANLTTSPVIPDGVTDLYCTFAGCVSLTDLSNFVVPTNVTYLDSTFSCCSSLTTAPEIPNNVISVFALFNRCTSLTGTVTINANPYEVVDDCFSRVDFAAQNLTLVGDSEMLDELGETGINYCVDCNGKCNGGH